jgi:hypothetical protein
MIKNEYADMLNRTADGNLSSLHKSSQKKINAFDTKIYNQKESLT